MRSALNILVQM